MLEDAREDGRVGEEGEEPAPSAASGAHQDIDAEHPEEKLRPGVSSRTRQGRRVGDVNGSSLLAVVLAGAEHRWVFVVLGWLRDDVVAVGGGRREDAVV